MLTSLHVVGVTRRPALRIASSRLRVMPTRPPFSLRLRRSLVTALVAVPLLGQLAACGSDTSEPEVPPTVNLTSPVGTTIPSGTEVTLVVAATDRRGRPVAQPTVVYSSSNTDVATVTAEGRLLAIRVGTASVTATALGASARLDITVTPGAPRQLLITTQPADAAAGRALGVQPVLELRDAVGNLVTSPALNVTAELVGGGRLTGTTSVLSQQGVATFTTLGIEGTVGARTLRFTANNVPAATSNGITLQPGAPSRLVVRTQPGTVAAGEPFATSPAADIVDVSGNVVPVSLPVSVALTGEGLTLGGTTTVTSQAGVAIFPGLTANGRAGTAQLTFSSGTLTVATTADFTVEPGPARTMRFRTQPAGAVSGAPLTTQPVLELRDAFDNVATTSTVTVSAAISGTGALIGNSVSARQGLATFTSLALVGLIGERTLTFSAPGVIPITSGALQLSAGAPAVLQVRTPPSGAGLNTPFTVQPVFEVRDGAGNLAPSPVVPVTATLTSGDGTLSGTTTRNSINALVSFTDLGVTGSTPGTRVIRFAGPGLVAVSSSVTPCDGARAPRLQLSAAAVSFNLVRLAPPAEESLAIIDGNASCTPLATPNIVINYQNATAGWLAVTVVDNNTRLLFRASPGATAAGSYSAQVTVSEGGNSIVVPVSFTVRPQLILTYGTAGQKVNELGVGATTTIVPTVRDELGNAVAEPVTLVSRAPSVATVNTGGTITAVASGSAWLVASVAANGGVFDSIYVNVRRTTGAVIRADLSRYVFPLGTNFTVPLVLDTRGATIGGARIVFSWPTVSSTPPLLRLVTAVPGALGSPTITNDVTTGTTRIVISSATGLTGTIPLGTFDFAPSALGNSTLVLRVEELTDLAGVSLLSTVNNLQYPLVIR